MLDRGTPEDSGGQGGTAPLFSQVLGDSFELLPKAVQRFHSHRGRALYAGRADIEGADRLIGWIAARIAGFPSPGRDVPVQVSIDAMPEREIWVRQFGDRRFRSTIVLNQEKGVVEERVGAFHFVLDLHVASGRLYFPVASGRLFGVLPIPRLLLPVSMSSEGEDEAGRFTFDISVCLLGGARIAAYRGFLEPVAGP